MAKKSVTKKPQKRLMCTECKKPISRKNGAYVLLGTYNRPAKDDHEGYFHFPCFVDWFNAKVDERARGVANPQGMINLTSLINDPQLQKLAAEIMKEEEKPVKKKRKNGTNKKTKRAKAKKK